MLTFPHSVHSCKCGDPALCGPRCDLYNPCIENLCANGGICVEQCGDESDYYCNCTSEFAGKNCTEPVSSYIASSAIIHLHVDYAQFLTYTNNMNKSVVIPIYNTFLTQFLILLFLLWIFHLYVSTSAPTHSLLFYRYIII